MYPRLLQQIKTMLFLTSILDSGNAWSKQVDVGDTQSFIKIDTGADVTTSQDNSINNAWVRDMHFKYLIAYCADMTATNFRSLGHQSPTFVYRSRCSFAEAHGPRCTWITDTLSVKTSYTRFAYVGTSPSHQRTPHRHQGRPDVFSFTLFRNR